MLLGFWLRIILKSQQSNLNHSCGFHIKVTHFHSYGIHSKYCLAVQYIFLADLVPKDIIQLAFLLCGGKHANVDHMFNQKHEDISGSGHILNNCVKGEPGTGGQVPEVTNDESSLALL